MRINEVGVVGCGFMGSGIVQVCAQNGYQVTVLEINDEALKRGLANIDSQLCRAVGKGRMLHEERAAVLGRIKGTTTMKELAPCDIVIEAATENLGLKKEIFRELDRTCRPDIILASSTSTVSIANLAGATKRPGNVIGIHFLSPVPPSRLVEIVRPDTTSDETCETACEFCKSMGKDVIVAQDITPFVFNYLYLTLTRAALELMENKIASAEDIDKAARLGLGHPLGPIELIDFNGVDTIHLVFKTVFEQTDDPRFEPSKLLKKLCDEGSLGRKTGRGFYDYAGK
ncbi:MAG TPA: 3-hydroxyacyl-CoA dehydrogenase family protein [Anaerolineales bacterium]|nr:3-hydroxyacyl-CoA dehydrogenase family protein [Anaerolineales bacterium]